MGISLAIGWSLGSAWAITPVVLIDDTLTQQSVRLASLHDGVLSFFNDQRHLRDAPVSDFVQLRVALSESHEKAQARPAEPGAGLAKVELVDGQCFVGRWGGAQDEGQSLRWISPDFGDLSVRLDDIRRVSWARSDAGAARLGGAPSDDTVTLINHDQLHGFVSEVAAAHLTLIAGDTQQPIVLPIERLAQVAIAHPTLPDSPTQPRVTLDDGSVLEGQSLEITGEQLTFSAMLPGRPARLVTLGLKRVRQIDFVAGGLRLRSLAAMDRQVVAGGKVFGLATPVEQVGDDLHLHAPVRIAVTVPDTARRLACIAEIDWTDVRQAVRGWSDCELVIYRSSEDENPMRYRLNAEHSQVAVNVPLTGSGLMIAVEPGVNGPILDRVRLRAGQLLEVAPTPPAHTSPATRW